MSLNQKSKNFKGKVLFENTIFKIQFDINLPRPHLLIFFKKDIARKDQTNVEHLSELEIESLILLVENFMKAINAQNEAHTISFHTGGWVSKPTLLN